MLLTQFFHPDESAISRMGTDLAEDLVALGFRVTVVAGRGTYLGGERLAAREQYKGIDIIRAQGTSLGKRNLTFRLADYISYSASAFTSVAFAEKPDVILAMSTPPFVPAIATAMRVLRGVRFVFWAQDLYPELAVEFGVLQRDSMPTRFLERVSAAILRQADSVITVGEAMAARLVSKGALPSRVHVVPNWADPEAIRPVTHADNTFRATQRLNGKRVVLYSGNMGRSHDIETILAAADTLRERTEVAFVFVGDGAKARLVAEAAHGNAAIRLVPYQPRHLLSHSLSAGDLHVVTQEAKTLGLMEPSKLYGVMAAGRPVLYIGPRGSEVAQTILRESLGEVVANGDVQGVVEAIRRIFQDGTAMGLRGRAALERHHGRTFRTTQIADQLMAIAG